MFPTSPTLETWAPDVSGRGGSTVGVGWVKQNHESGGSAFAIEGLNQNQLLGGVRRFYDAPPVTSRT